MNIFARFSRNRVNPNDNIYIRQNHKRLCRCRNCRNVRKKEMKVSCAFLMPLIGLITILSFI